MKKIFIALLAFLMLFLTACGESKEEYIEKCQDPQTLEEYEKNSDEYIGNAYRIEGMVMGAEVLEKSEDGHNIYAFTLVGSGNSEGRLCTIQYYEDVTDEEICAGDKVIVYGDFTRITGDSDYPYRILIDGNYVEYTYKNRSALTDNS